MIEFVIVVLGISLLLYIVLGGADFGAGIVEMFADDKRAGTISQAIAPIWEANHIWLILAVVILFNGFPEAYSTISIALHIPLLLTLLGIIFRGTAFTFRYYDVGEKNANKYYNSFFQLSSLLTPFFLGITFGAVVLGRIKVQFNQATFGDIYIFPWLNMFCIAMGIFLTILFATLACAYLIGEAKDDAERKLFVKHAKIYYILLILSGLLVFTTSGFTETNLFKAYFNSLPSILSVVVATIAAPFVWIGFNKEKQMWVRILLGLQTAAILIGWMAVQYPILIKISDAESLTVYNASAPESTLRYLVYALIVGVLIILPSLALLFKVFKFQQKSDGI